MIKLCSVVIPVYKENLNKFEILSFLQCCKILYKYDIYIVTHENLNLSIYNELANSNRINLKIIYFPKTYFESIKGYNKLMLSYDFYKTFDCYEYILIYQLDAYVFKDELIDWCEKGYDYIGAPWFGNFQDVSEEHSRMSVGNGGFSLRKIQYFTKVLKYKGKVFNNTYFKNVNIFRRILYFLGFHNNMKFILKTIDINEDHFYCGILKDSNLHPNVPFPKLALAFSFERSPSYLFNLNNKQLPFGCHAFFKYEYDSFWSKYIN